MIHDYFEQNAGKLALVDIDIHVSDQSLWYTGVWCQSTVKQTIVHDVSWDDFVATWTDLSTKRGMRLIKIASYQTYISE